MVVKVQNSSVRVFARILLTLNTNSPAKPCCAPLACIWPGHHCASGITAVSIGGGEVPSSILMRSERTANLDGRLVTTVFAAEARVLSVFPGDGTSIFIVMMHQRVH